MTNTLISAHSYNGVQNPPNWVDRRVRDRVRSACEWAELYLHPTRTTDIHHTKLRRIFGNPASAIGRYLHDVLLISVPNSHQVGVKSTSYFVNKPNLTFLQSLLVSSLSLQVYGVQNPSGVKNVDTGAHSSAHSYNGVQNPVSGVIHSGFEYTDKSNRLWHEYQRIRRGEKDRFWVQRGLPFNYDIVSAAPTILVQLAERAGLKTRNLMAVMTYLAAPKKFRSYMSRLSGLDYDDAKQLLTSMFNGARLQSNSFCSAFHLLDRDKVRMKVLQEDPNVRLLVQNISSVWSALRASTNLPLKTGSQKWSLYFEYERAILEIAVKYFDELGIEYFLEHDGYRTSQKIDATELQRRVLNELGLKITLEQK
jgi:hypothetical protein